MNKVILLFLFVSCCYCYIDIYNPELCDKDLVIKLKDIGDSKIISIAMEFIDEDLSYKELYSYVDLVMEDSDYQIYFYTDIMNGIVSFSSLPLRTIKVRESLIYGNLSYNNDLKGTVKILENVEILL